MDTVEFLWSTVHSHMTILTVHSHMTILGKEAWGTHKFELRTTYESAWSLNLGKGKYLQLNMAL